MNIPTVQPIRPKAVFTSRDVETPEQLARKQSDLRYKAYIKTQAGKRVRAC